MRIALGGFLTESHSFAPHPTTWQDFVQPAGYLPLTSGAALLEAIPGKSIPAAGALATARAAGVEIAPLTWCFANPAGPVQDEAFERISALICSDLGRALDAGPLDGIYLDLHGAAVSVSFPDAEGELLRRVRAIAGHLPLTISVDPHCNLTRAMVDLCDAIVPFRTYPHIDMIAAGARAMELLLARIRRGAPFARAFREIDFFIPLNSQCTQLPAMAAVMAERARLAADASIAELGFCFGFPYADFSGCGPALAAYAVTQAAADASADALHRFVLEREASFRLNALPAAAAVAEAIRRSNSAMKPVVIADTQDNPGAGGHGDTTGLLAELIAQGARGAVFALINDPASAAACHRAGERAKLSLMLGGVSDGVPLRVDATVLKLTDGHFVCTGPMGRGNHVHHGQTALIEAAPGVRVIVVSRKTQAYDQALFRHVGIEPGEAKILVLKSSVYFRADFEPIADSVLVGLAPGPALADPSAFPFQNLRPKLRKTPRGKPDHVEL
jgi:microcystin degradation protein MlrC